jgi:hypothetical protein
MMPDPQAMAELVAVERIQRVGQDPPAHQIALEAPHLDDGEHDLYAIGWINVEGVMGVPFVGLQNKKLTGLLAEGGGLQERNSSAKAIACAGPAKIAAPNSDPATTRRTSDFLSPRVIGPWSPLYGLEPIGLNPLQHPFPQGNPVKNRPVTERKKEMMSQFSDPPPQSRFFGHLSVYGDWETGVGDR